MITTGTRLPASARGAVPYLHDPRNARRQQRVATRLTEEELQRIRRRLDDRRRGRRLLRALLDHPRVVDDLDPARLDLAVEQVDLELVELVGLDQLVELGLPHAGLGGRVEQCDDVLVLEHGLDLDRHQGLRGLSQPTVLSKHS